MISIFVAGGVVQEVIGAKYYRVIDLDCLEGGECPVCLENSLVLINTETKTLTREVPRTVQYDDDGVLVTAIIPGQSVTETYVAEYGGELYCPVCEINWEEVDWQELHKALNALHAEKDA